VAAGIHPDYETACGRMVRYARTHEPNRDLAACYQAKYDRYQEMLEVMQPVWSKMVWKSP
jgi:sugar (pentulose or hexulose) kinase